MSSRIQAYITEIAAACSAELGNRLRPETTRFIASQVAKDLADSPQALFIDGVSREDDSVLMVSNPGFPEFVGTAASKAVEAQSALGGALGDRVCTPVLTGAQDGVSYSLYKRFETFSSNRFLRKAQTLYTHDVLNGWLSEVFEQTKEEQTDAALRDEKFCAPLRALSSDDSLDASARQAAAALEAKVTGGDLRTFHCLQHGDFWFGNVFFKRSSVRALSPMGKDFKIIDWAGSQITGYPGIDAFRFFISVFGQRKMAAQGMEKYCRLTGLTRAEFALHCVCAMGAGATDLGQFPKDRFNALTLRLVSFLDQHDFLDT